jgi:hypothetical protein
MPIQGRSLGDVVARHAHRLNHLLGRTVTRTRLISFALRTTGPRQPRTIQLAFWQRGQPVTARLRTGFGPIELWVGQLCESTAAEDGTHTLRIVKYGYHLIPIHLTELMNVGRGAE